MKQNIRSLILALTLMITLSLVLPTAAQADSEPPEPIVVDPGQTESITFTYSGVCAVEGEILFSDDSIISSRDYEIGELGMSGLVEGGKFFLYTDNKDGVDGKIVVRVTVHSAAAKGSSCTVTFRYRATTPGSSTPGPVQTITQRITVRTDGAPGEDSTEPTKPKPNVTYADTTALQAQISIAKNLIYYDYTKETWAVVAEAVEKGEKLLRSTSQSAVDNATRELKTALENLVPMDYTALQDALESASEMDKHEAIAKLWTRFILALENARLQRTSGDQAAVDAAAAELIASKEALQKGLEEMGELVVVEKEVPVEVEPSYTFCNNNAHTLFLILMIISFVINLALITLIGLYFYKKNRKEKDTTPLVEYDLDDDEEGLQINEDVLE